MDKAQQKAIDDNTIEQMANAFRSVLSEGQTSESQRIILIKRIPIICNDILEMKTNLKWILWLVMGVAGGIGALAVAYIMK